MAVIDLKTLETAVDRAAVRYDRAGDQHYDVASALIKSIRGSDVDAAMHYLARMIEAGEDPRFIARRLVISASEDIGMGDPTALGVAVAAAEAVQLIGMPEARINLAQAVVALALAPKSNAVIMAIDAAIADVKAGKVGPVPPHLRDAHYAGAKKIGHGSSYQYSHNDPRGVVAAAVRAGRRRQGGLLPADPARRRSGVRRALTKIREILKQTLIYTSNNRGIQPCRHSPWDTFTTRFSEDAVIIARPRSATRPQRCRDIS